MTAAEIKAKELISKYYMIKFIDDFGHESYETLSHGAAKQCALITVNEILQASTIKMSEHDSTKFVYIDKFWYEVKTAIENSNPRP